MVPPNIAQARASADLSGFLAYMVAFSSIPTVLSIVALVKGIAAKKRGHGGKTTAGIVLGSIAAGIIVLPLVVMLIIYLTINAK